MNMRHERRSAREGALDWIGVALEVITHPRPTDIHSGCTPRIGKFGRTMVIGGVLLLASFMWFVS
jgi:hypothetical protein